MPPSWGPNLPDRGTPIPASAGKQQDSVHTLISFGGRSVSLSVCTGVHGCALADSECLCVCTQCGLALVSVGVSVSLVSRRPGRADPQARCVEHSGHTQRPEATGTEGRRGSDEGHALPPPHQTLGSIPGMGDLSRGCTEGREGAKNDGYRLPEPSRTLQNLLELLRTFQDLLEPSLWPLPSCPAKTSMSVSCPGLAPCD